MEKFGLGNQKEEVKNWYDGFSFGALKDIYNPWSITNYLDKKRFDTYWASTSSNGLISKLLKISSSDIKEKMEMLVSGKEIVVNFDEQIVFEQLEQNANAIWSLMVASGYLKIEQIEYRGMLRTPWYHLKVTNLETMSMFENWFTVSASSYNVNGNNVWDGNMNYRISDISNIFQISKEMIRYYEKQGAISSVRKEDNNYRIYSIWDIFNFLDFLQYKELGISAKELTKIRENQFSKNMTERLTALKQELDEEIRYKCNLRSRTEEILERMECGEYNENNYWVRRIPGRYMFHFLRSVNDEYEDINLPLEIRKRIFSAHLMPMLDPCIEFQEKNEWYYSISEKYAEMLDDVCLENATYISPQICLCSVVNMGEIGEFTSDCLSFAKSYMEQKGYKQDGTARGILIGRGKEEQGYIRRMELQIPVKIK